MTEKHIPQAGELAPAEGVPLGFERIYTGQQGLEEADTSDLDLVYSTDEAGYVTMQYSLWGFAHTTPDKWNDEIRAINKMQADLGLLPDGVRRIRRHMASLVPCDSGVPVTVDEILNAIGTGDLPDPAFHPGCWMSIGRRGTQPEQAESMRVIEDVLRSYLDGQPEAPLIEKYPYARGFIERTFAWLGPRQIFSELQLLLMERLLLPFAFFTKRNTDQHAIYVDLFKPGGRGQALDAQISAMVGLPEIYPSYRKEYRENLASIEDPHQQTIYTIACHIAHGVHELSDCHHNTFRYIERWIHAVGTMKWDIPTRRPHTESERLGKLLFGYALGIDRWLQGVPQQFLLLDLGHVDLGFDPKNEILRVYAYLGEEHSPVKAWLAACLWYTLVLMPPASLTQWGHQHRELMQRTADLGISVRTWMDAQLAAPPS
ncbi:MAG: hypothetical protein P1S60_05785 [Anaerolineae bacterium]|nr:hypothetical protein [Anaerolineae bacterium]